MTNEGVLLDEANTLPANMEEMLGNVIVKPQECPDTQADIAMANAEIMQFPSDSYILVVADESSNTGLYAVFRTNEGIAILDLTNPAHLDTRGGSDVEFFGAVIPINNTGTRLPSGASRLLTHRTRVDNMGILGGVEVAGVASTDSSMLEIHPNTSRSTPGLKLGALRPDLVEDIGFQVNQSDHIRGYQVDAVYNAARAYLEDNGNSFGKPSPDGTNSLSIRVPSPWKS